MRVYGRNVFREILYSNFPVRMVYFSENGDKELVMLIEQAKSRKLPYTISPKKILTRLCNFDKHQGVVVDIGEFPYKDESSIIETENGKGFFVILDQLQDPHNFGAIIRSAVGAGANAIVIPKNNSVKVTPTVVKVSVGTIFRIPIVEVVNISRFIEKIKKVGFWVYAADMQGVAYYRANLKRPVAIVFGSEGEGIRRGVKQKCDGVVSIPMKNSIDSLNVSVSAGIILFEVARQNENIDS
ncbi:23S rRNA (guanosine(2251)-2'-O)-methyltransferase RlmB [Thermosipho ferrireducens]|uniref:23S rRNA (Guanosine(2251)-2'-O)-methyltransferase RlmB n=1 Tax=Thermosipho ferrireducens TaxID=2571116 RepID=A0ABX7S854_9BACT|nr:23S rRNA (guanosine(2251)-2'-O)-methyltransferase RlmB [Thermosipho ferrireducens]QTA37456.1 23S rRNA (guanosine(2251)-2'-O)-methyltransferase RlmB [Thermosipho ferrireducens]